MFRWSAEILIALAIWKKKTLRTAVLLWKRSRWCSGNYVYVFVLVYGAAVSVLSLSVFLSVVIVFHY